MRITILNVITNKKKFHEELNECKPWKDPFVQKTSNWNPIPVPLTHPKNLLKSYFPKTKNQISNWINIQNLKYRQMF